MKSLGICLGASSVSIARLETDGSAPSTSGKARKQPPRMIGNAVYPHDGNPKRTLVEALAGLDVNRFDRIAVTGRKFRSVLRLSSISEPRAVEYAYRYTRPPGVSCPAIVSAGGETFMAYVLDSSGRIANVLTGNKCASGTGEFFLQQIRRMNVSLDEAARWSSTEKPYHVSGRCSVFCKSDCTHATNKGVPKSQVTAGLCKMMADKIIELLKRVDRRNIMLTGGTTRNGMMVTYLKQAIPGLIIPSEAPYFEALGAALWALQNSTQRPADQVAEWFIDGAAAPACLPPLNEAADQVTFKTIKSGRIVPGKDCILGLDVGSTTTKAVLMQKDSNALLASVYLRTDGDPVGASRKCYTAILKQVKGVVDPAELPIVGLGVCGSGRQIAGLHALTDGVINEIVAHAAAAVFFDPEVDTLFEIGGQDAKYTYITNAVPSDYAMNEACSAGTGSFLEESALESLGVAMEDIAGIALQGSRPPNFNDQCAAFIASDIKNAIHEGIPHADIVAGLVYSICMNYSNRVKGNRTVGRKVFMQGGVCYNHAVPLAMATLVGKPIVVPPEPGLMGAFGVALEVSKRLDLGLMERKAFDLAQLAARDVRYCREFTCRGGKEKCDRKCTITMIELEGKRYPFGGACNRYDNLRRRIEHDTAKLDLVRVRQELVFNLEGTLPRRRQGQGSRGRIGFNRSFLVNSYYPLYAAFFSRIGYEPVLPDEPSQTGIEQRNAAFCYPGELAHGFFHSLIGMEPAPDYLFLPHAKSIPLENGTRSSQVCPLVQGETFYLQSTFRDRLKELEKKGTRVLAPLLDLNGGFEKARAPLLETAGRMHVDRQIARRAFDTAVAQQQLCVDKMRAAGLQALADLEADPDRTGVVIFSRPYNGLVAEANMGIPAKLATRGITVIPLDFLPFEKEDAKRHMYWGMGQIILRAARLVKRHPQLFGVFITNFSCGPDSFIVGYFRSIMGRKPSLTLELDSHTADAGLDTRIEAFLDIVSAYRQLTMQKRITEKVDPFKPAEISLERGVSTVVTTSGKKIPLTDPRVTLLVPSMGKLGSEGIAAVFRGVGVNAVAHPPSDENVLKIGRGNTSCKECLPLILTTGTLLNYVSHRKPGEVIVYLLATGSGPCRFGQYYIFMEDLIRRLQIPDVAVFTLTSENSYLGLDKTLERRTWWAVVVSDMMEDIRSMLLANAVDVVSALSRFDTEWQAILEALESGRFKHLENQLSLSTARFREIPLKKPARDVPTINLTGEIFVRRDGLSRRYLTEKLAEKGFAATCTPVAEWVFYSEYLVEEGLNEHTMTLSEKLRFKIRKKVMLATANRLRAILEKTGLFHSAAVDIPTIVGNAVPYISRDLTGEAVLTIGGSLTEIGTHACGVIAIGPFGCMPNRLSEAVMHETMRRSEKLKTEPDNDDLKAVLNRVDDLPFLAIESDGSPFPQIIEAKLEAFCLRSRRLHEKMLRAGTAQPKST